MPLYYDQTAAKADGRAVDGKATRTIAGGGIARRSILHPMDWLYAPDVAQGAFANNGLPKCLDDESAAYNFAGGPIATQAGNYLAVARRLRAACPDCPIGVAYILPYYSPELPEFVAAVKPIVDLMDFCPVDFSGGDLPDKEFRTRMEDWPDLIRHQAGWDIPLVAHVNPWGSSNEAFDERLRLLATRFAGVCVWMAVDQDPLAKEMPNDLQGISHRVAREFPGQPIRRRLAIMADAAVFAEAGRWVAEVDRRRAEVAGAVASFDQMATAAGVGRRNK